MTAALNLQMFETGVQSEINDNTIRKIRLCRMCRTECLITWWRHIPLCPYALYFQSNSRVPKGGQTSMAELCLSVWLMSLWRLLHQNVDLWQHCNTDQRRPMFLFVVLTALYQNVWCTGVRCMLMSQSALMVCHCTAVYQPGMQTLVFSLPV